MVVTASKTVVSSRSGMPDYFVFGGDGGVANGFFDAEWQIDPAFAIVESSMTLTNAGELLALCFVDDPTSVQANYIIDRTGQCFRQCRRRRLQHARGDEERHAQQRGARSPALGAARGLVERHLEQVLLDAVIEVGAAEDQLAQPVHERFAVVLRDTLPVPHEIAAERTARGEPVGVVNRVPAPGQTRQLPGEPICLRSAVFS